MAFCHSERREESNVYNSLDNLDSSAKSQNDITTQSLWGEGRVRGGKYFD